MTYNHASVSIDSKESEFLSRAQGHYRLATLKDLDIKGGYCLWLPRFEQWDQIERVYPILFQLFRLKKAPFETGRFSTFISEYTDEQRAEATQLISRGLVVINVPPEPTDTEILAARARVQREQIEREIEACQQVIERWQLKIDNYRKAMEAIQ